MSLTVPSWKLIFLGKTRFPLRKPLDMSFTISNIRLNFLYYLETNNTSPTLEELNLAGWSPMY